MDLMKRPTNLIDTGWSVENAPAPLKPPEPLNAQLGRQVLGASSGVGSGVINVADELEAAYQSAKRLMIAAEYDDETPLNQKAQVIGAMNTVLASITKSRSEIWSAERNRAMETCLINVLKQHPELQKAFMADYKVALEKLK